MRLSPLPKTNPRLRVAVDDRSDVLVERLEPNMHLFLRVVHALRATSSELLGGGRVERHVIDDSSDRVRVSPDDALKSESDT